MTDKRKLKLDVRGSGYEDPPFTKSEQAEYDRLITKGWKSGSARHAALNGSALKPLTMTLQAGEVVEVVAIGERLQLATGQVSLRVRGVSGVSGHVNLSDTEPVDADPE
jgi:hypothetical protein